MEEPNTCRRLEEIEEMAEKDPSELAKLVEEYREEHWKEGYRSEETAAEKGVVEDPGGARERPERASGSGDTVMREEAKAAEVSVDKDPTEFALGDANDILMPAGRRAPKR